MSGPRFHARQSCTPDGAVLRERRAQVEGRNRERRTAPSRAQACALCLVSGTATFRAGSQAHLRPRTSSLALPSSLLAPSSSRHLRAHRRPGAVSALTASARLACTYRAIQGPSHLAHATVRASGPAPRCLVSSPRFGVAAVIDTVSRALTDAACHHATCAPEEHADDRLHPQSSLSRFIVGGADLRSLCSVERAPSECRTVSTTRWLPPTARAPTQALTATLLRRL